MSKILIVDDDPHIRELAKVFLRNDGFEVYEAADGVEALAKLDALKVDLFIIDIMMPNMDGWELCRELRASVRFADPDADGQGRDQPEAQRLPVGHGRLPGQTLRAAGAGGAGQGPAEALPDRQPRKPSRWGNCPWTARPSR